MKKTLLNPRPCKHAHKIGGMTLSEKREERMEAVKTESAEEEEEEDLRITNQRWSTGAIGIPLRREMMKTGRRGETRWGETFANFKQK